MEDECVLVPELIAEVKSAAEEALNTLGGERVGDHVTVVRGYLQLMGPPPHSPERLGNLRKSLAALADVTEKHRREALTERLDLLIRRLQ